MAAEANVVSPSRTPPPKPRRSNSSGNKQHGGAPAAVTSGAAANEAADPHSQNEVGNDGACSNDAATAEPKLEVEAEPKAEVEAEPNLDVEVEAEVVCTKPRKSVSWSQDLDLHCKLEKCDALSSRDLFVLLLVVGAARQSSMPDFLC